MKIAIVDDLASERALLRGRLERQLLQRNIQASVLEFSSGEQFLEAERQESFSVVFLDIYMTGANGIETAKELRRRDAACLLIFTTTSTDHALEGFQVRAMHYLVKPFSETDVARLMDEILARIPRPEQFLELKVDGNELRVSFQSIVYAEHFAHMIYIHTTAKRTLATRQPFRTFSAPLEEDPRFFVCGRGVIVNMEHATELDGSAFRMNDGTAVPVSRERLRDAKQAFMEYLLQRGNEV